MMRALDGLAMIVAAVSLVFAAAMGAAMLVLLLRRHRGERQSLARNQHKIVASRVLLSSLTSADLGVNGVELPAEAWQAALSHLLRLVRGNDRVRLLAVAEGQGLFADALAELRNRRPARRIDAMRLLEQFGSPECIAGLSDRMQADPVMAVRLEAAAALARIGALPPLPELLVALGMDRQPVTRLHAALFRSLAQRDAEQIAEFAGSARYGALRPLLVEAMGWTADLDMLPKLVGHASDPNHEVRCSAIRAARHLGHPGAGQWIVPMLNDGAEAVRVQAAQACGQLGLKDAITSLERLATEPSWWIRMRAKSALELLRPHRGPALSLVSAAT